MMASISPKRFLDCKFCIKHGAIKNSWYMSYIYIEHIKYIYDNITLINFEALKYLVCILSMIAIGLKL